MGCRSKSEGFEYGDISQNGVSESITRSLCQHRNLRFVIMLKTEKRVNVEIALFLGSGILEQ